MVQSSEIASDMTIPPSNPTGVRKFMTAPLVNANVATAHTDNILGREYVLRSGIEWKSTDAIGLMLGTTDPKDSTIALPHAFWDNDLATVGLSNYHEFQRMDFEVRVKVNPSSFHAGQLLVVCLPGYPVDLDLQSLGTFTQCPLS